MFLEALVDRGELWCVISTASVDAQLDSKKWSLLVVNNNH